MQPRMSPVSVTTNDAHIVITIDKASFPPEALSALVRSITAQMMDISHNALVPLVGDDEQREIEVLLRNPECHIYDDEAVQL
jgi:hypothetical protein